MPFIDAPLESSALELAASKVAPLVHLLRRNGVKVNKSWCSKDYGFVWCRCDAPEGSHQGGSKRGEVFRSDCGRNNGCWCEAADRVYEDRLDEATEIPWIDNYDREHS